MITLPITTTPVQHHIDHHLLLSHLINVERKALMLKYIQGPNAIFECSIKYPIQLKHHAVYVAVATVPLTTFQHMTSHVSHVYARTVQDMITFRFENFVDSHGYGVRSVR